MKSANAPARSTSRISAVWRKSCPSPALPLGSRAFAAIGLPGFANFAGEIMVFFGAFRNGATVSVSIFFKSRHVLALWGVVISAVYMLRAYRRVFMGTMATSRSGLT